MDRVEVVLLDDTDAEVGRFDRTVAHAYEVNDFVEHPDDGDLWLVCAVERTEPPYAQRVMCVYVGRDDSDPLSSESS